MTAFDFSSDKDRLVFLEQSPILKAENIVVSFSARIKSGNKAGSGLIELKLNNKYKQKTIVSDIFPDSWSKTVNAFRRRVEQKDISKNHVSMIIDVLDNNAGKIIETSSKKQAEAARSFLSVASRKDYAIQSALELVKSKTEEMFLDQVKKPFIAVTQEGHIETMSIYGADFEKWLTAAYYFKTKNASEHDDDSDDSDDKIEYDPESNSHKINHEAYDVADRRRFGGGVKILADDEVSKVQKILSFEAEKAGKVETLYVRIASFVDTSKEADLDSNYICYDLCNPKWEIVKITRHGWSIESKFPKSLFKRYSLMNEQVKPKAGYPSDIFDQFMSLTNLQSDNDNILLAKVYIVSLILLANLPKPLLLPHGPHGSAKSTFHELVKKVIDPAAALTSAFPNSLAELVQQLDHNYLTFFDNVSEIRHLTSDALCRAVTGSGFVKRTLYENDEDFVYNMKRAIGFNGINIIANRPDLLDRVLSLDMKQIDKRKRRKLEFINNEFQRLLPYLLAYLFDVVVKVLDRIGEVKLEDLPRMADFAEMGELVARCLGYKDNEFIQAYNRNNSNMNEEAVEVSTVATAIIELMSQTPVWKGKFDALRVKLNEVVKAKKELSTIVFAKGWPRTPHALRARLTEIEPNLKEIGIIVDYEKDAHTKTDTITIVANNYITKDQTFWAAFKQLEAEEAANPENMSADDKCTIKGTKLQETLVASGKFDDGEANQMITDKVKAGKLKVVMGDTYRRVSG
jgi:hypothetical protein